jgi:hypothetical protein
MDELDATPNKDSGDADRVSFPYDDRPVRPMPSEEHPLENLAGRGQTEGTPMGLGPLAWIPIAVLVAGLLVYVVFWVSSLFH